MPSLPPDIDLLPVTSSTVSGIGYHETDRVLAVRFHSSPEPYYYRDIPTGVWHWLQVAPSKGKFLHVYVKGKFAVSRDYPVLRCRVHDMVAVAETGVVHRLEVS